MEDITVAFPKGTITALVGPSGSGKTTFLRSLNRMNDKVRGFCKNNGGIDLALRRGDPRRQGRPSRPPPPRSGDGIPAPEPVPDVDPGQRRRRCSRHTRWRSGAPTKGHRRDLSRRRWACGARGSDRLNDSPFRLSGGQQQLLRLAGVLAVEPEVLLLDEPTSSLDPHSTESVEELVRRLTPELTVIIVTHNLAQARRLSDNTIFFYEGHLIETGPTKQLFENPQRIETARYLGAEDDFR